VAAWATDGPAVKVTAAESPASKPAAPAIRRMHRPARLIRLFMNTICMASENILFINPYFLPSFFGGGDAQLKVCVVDHTVNHEDNSVGRA
jgi:hypothetical protein